MAVLRNWKNYLYVVIAGLVTSYAAKHPAIPQELVFTLLGILAHAIGVETERTNAAFR